MAVRIIHTSDFHIGKRLYDYDLSADHSLFFHWLIQVVIEKKVDYLLLAGDIFDQSNPSQESLRLYYAFLAELAKTGCRAIITAGNHDSPALIDAPENILNALKPEISFYFRSKFFEDYIYSILKEIDLKFTSNYHVLLKDNSPIEIDFLINVGNNIYIVEAKTKMSSHNIDAYEKKCDKILKELLCFF